MFDSHTLAVFGGDPGKLLGSVELGQRGTKVLRTGLTPAAELTVAGMRVAIEGQIFVE